MAIQRKICSSEIKEYDEKDLSVVHFISSELPDRGGDILYAAKNDKGAGMIMLGRPVVLQQHGWGEMGMEPIAKPVWIKASKFKDRNGIECKTQFFPDDLGKRLFKKTSEGYMPNWSVGWRPIEGKVEVKNSVRHVYEWELLEYSIVGVPMQPDAQTGEISGDFLFKMIPESEEKRGELVGWKKEDDGFWEEKPYPNEHSCRLEDPDKYIRVRRQNDKFGKGIHAIWGVQGGGKPVELQAIRFAKSKFTAAEARAWIKDHDYKCKLFEPASEKCVKCGKPMLIKWEQDVSGDKCGLTCETECSYVHDGECEKKEGEEVICQGCKKPVKYADIPESGMGYIRCPNCGKLIDQTGKVLDDKVSAGEKVESKQVFEEGELPFDPQSDEDVGFVMVDADVVRKENGTEDFVHGGHHYVFDFIPEPEIWIDERMTDEDIMSLKVSLFVERQMMKYCEATLTQCQEIGSISGKWISHMMDPEIEGGGHHDEKDLHYFTHDGNHWHNRGQTIRWDDQTERYEVHSIVGGSIINLTEEQKELYKNDVDKAIKQVAVKYGLRKASPVEPEAEEEKPTIKFPEPKKIIVVTEEDKKQAEQDRKRQLTEMLAPVAIQIEEVIKKIPEIVKEELRRYRGKVD